MKSRSSKRILSTSLIYWMGQLCLIDLLLGACLFLFFTRLFLLNLFLLPVAIWRSYLIVMRIGAYQRLIYDEARQQITLKHPFRPSRKIPLSRLRTIRPAKGPAVDFSTDDTQTHHRQKPSLGRKGAPKDWLVETQDGRQERLFLQRPRREALNHMSFFQSLESEADRQASCLVCNGQGKLRGYQPALGEVFDEQICYACGGSGRGRDAERSEAYLQLRLAINKKQRLRKQVWQLQSSLNELDENFTAHASLSDELRAQYRQTRKAYEDQLALKEAHIHFYESYEQGLHHYLFKLFLTRMLSKKQEELHGWQEENVRAYADATVDASRMDESEELVNAMARLEMQLEQNQSLDIAQELREELEKLRQGD